MKVQSLLKDATSKFALLEKLGLNFSSFVIRVNLLHPSASSFLHGLLPSFLVFSYLS